MKENPGANLAIISVPGQYAAGEAEKALDYGLHAFIFSDNVPVEEELKLKQKAHEKGLLVMGPIAVREYCRGSSPSRTASRQAISASSAPRAQVSKR